MFTKKMKLQKQFLNLEPGIIPGCDNKKENSQIKIDPSLV